MSSTFPNEDPSDVNNDDWKNVLPFENSAHNSATILVPKEENPLYVLETFESRLKSTCEMLKNMEKSSIWVEVPMSRSSLIEKMSSLGFQYHHAQGTVAKLNLWLREDTESKVPEFATHHVGVGAVVVNSRKEVLCVRELRKNYMPWKIPGGLSELGESIAEAAVREVMEETGVPTKFHSILSFRHTHGLANGRSDLYFVCRLDPLEEIDEKGNSIIPEPFAQACEIEATQWVPLREYRAMVEGTDGSPGHPMMRNVMVIYDQGLRIQPKEVNSIVPGRKPNPMYIPVVIDDETERGSTSNQ
jgi:ADP-ribose pyrophosphatase YjhB (NUDIX family)